MIEREAKLQAPVGFELTAAQLDELSPVILPERNLDATYFDTESLRLTRSGISVRYRDGDDHPGWTVKLPEAADGGTLTRAEIDIDGPADDVPDEIAELVLAVARSHPLTRVADIATLRRRVEIRDAEGHALVEVDDDQVRGTRFDGERLDFHEVEVEAKASGRDAKRVWMRTVGLLVDAGCWEEDAVPKVARVLGGSARTAPDVVVPDLDARPSLDDVVQHAIARSVAQMLRHDPGVRLGTDPEHVHQFRVATRRLRSDLGSFRPLLGPEARRLRDELKWIGSEVGAVRDTDVLVERLHAMAKELPGVDRAGAQALSAALDDQRAQKRRSMLDALRSARYVDLLDELVRAAAVPPLLDPSERSVPPKKMTAKLVRRQWKRLRRAVRNLPDHPSDLELHEIRILAKRCRYAAESTILVQGRRAERFASAIAHVQGALGDHQDTVVGEDWLRHAAAHKPEGAVTAGQLIAAERRARADLRRRWPRVWKRTSAKKLRGWFL